MAEVNLAALRVAIEEARAEETKYECVADERYNDGYKAGLLAAYVIAASL